MARARKETVLKAQSQTKNTHLIYWSIIMAFGIEDLERDVQKFQQDIENAKAKYLAEYAEYIDIATDLENIGQKYDFLLEEVEVIKGRMPEENDASDTLSDSAKSLLISGGIFLGVSGISFIVRQFNAWKLIKLERALNLNLLVQANRVRDMGIKSVQIIRNNPNLLARTQARSVLKNSRAWLNTHGFRTTNAINQIPAQLRLARASQAAQKTVIAWATKIAKFTAGVGSILSIIGVALVIRDVRERKKYLEEQKAALKQNLDDVNGYIAEANDSTKDIITAFSTYFNEFDIDSDGIFNENQDGFLDETGKQKFDNAVSELRAALNGGVKRMGELNATTKLANVRINRYISQGHKGKELVEEVVFETDLPEEVIQRLYVLKLQEVGSTVQEAIELSELPEDLIEKFYARGYLDDGKTVEETVELSGLAEEEVRRIFASKLLDERLNTENPDDFQYMKDIAEQAGVSEEVVLEIQVQKIPNLPIDIEEELEAELVTR